jgi:hypothetical protein
MMSVSQVADRPTGVLYTVAALSLIAGLIHLWVVPEHFEEWWGYGVFFLVAALAQVPMSRSWCAGPTGPSYAWA